MPKSASPRTRPTAARAAEEAPAWGTDAHAPAPSGDPAETARYIAQLTGELTHLAGAAKLETLAYLLAMARVEAEVLARQDA